MNKRLLILGGTRFLGRHVAEQALAAGWRVTLLHRGKSNPGLFPQAEHHVADRDGDLTVLGSSTWDVAIDTSAYVPRQVRHVAQALAGRVGHYQLVSSISVYADPMTAGADESAPLRSLPDPTVEAITGDTYGGLKALCEAAASEAFGERCLNVRPGLIVGPHDPTCRFTWWVQRVQRGGEVLAPGDPATPVQFIDTRDLAAWMLLQAERGTAGVFNLNGPNEPLTMGGLLEAARTTLNPAAQLHWVNERFVLHQGIAPWSDLPVWLPSRDAAMHTLSIARAVATGLRTRPLADTLRDTAAWWPTAPLPPPGAMARPAVGLSPEREAAALAAWKNRA